MSWQNEYPLPLQPPCKSNASSKTMTSTVKKEGDNKSRFSDRQVKLLETIFEAETKIDPLKKVQLARELGLHPRQVSIWFQNRRARWKSKQLEKEYQILKASYENLASQVESLKQEKQSLHKQVLNLSLALQNARELENGDVNSMYGKMEGQVEAEMKTINEFRRPDTINGNTAYEVVQDQPSLDELGDSSQASTEERCGVDASLRFDQLCGEAQWWNFWNC